MVRLWFVALCAGLLFAQEEEGEDEGIAVDEPPSAAEPEEAPAAEPERKPAGSDRAPGKKAGTTEVKRKVYSLTLPSDWVLEDDEGAKTELAWQVELPTGARAGLQLLRDENMLDPRSWSYYVADWFRENQRDATVEVRGKHVPLLLVSYPSGRIEARADLLAAAKSLTAEVEPWPPVPKGYLVSSAGTWIVARAPSVTKPLAPLEKAVKDAEKRFRREHGALPKSDAPLVILVHNTTAEAAKIDPEAAKSTDGFHSDYRGRRLFALPIPKGDAEQAGLLTERVHQHLFVARYGDARPAWIRVGEGVIGRAEALLGKPLPSLHEGFAAWYSTLKLHRADELEGLVKANAENWAKEGFFYVVALRGGKYRKEYRAFLDDLVETGDGPGAFARHLGTIDQEKLRASVHAYVTERLKTERPK
jgi:hypothetical protein